MFSDKKPLYEEALGELREMIDTGNVTCRGLKRCLSQLSQKTVPKKVLHRVRADLTNLAYYIKKLNRPGLARMIQWRVHLFNQLLKKQIFGDRFPWRPFSNKPPR